MAVRCPICSGNVGNLDQVPGHVRTFHHIFTSQPRGEGWFCRQPACNQWYATFHRWRQHINVHHGGGAEVMGGVMDVGIEFEHGNPAVEEEVAAGGEQHIDVGNANHEVDDENEGAENEQEGNGANGEDGNGEGDDGDNEDGGGSGSDPSDSDTSGSSGNEDEENMVLEDEDGDVPAHGRHDLRKHAADLIIELRSNCLTTREDVTKTISAVEKIIKADHHNLYQDFLEVLQRYNLDTFPDVRRVLLSLKSCDLFQGMRSRKGQVGVVNEYLRFIPPQNLYLGQRVDMINVQGFLQQRPVRQSFQYVKLTDILELVVSKPYVLDFIKTLRPNQREYMQYYCDGESYQNNAFLMRYPETLLLLLYYDEVEACNAQGSKTGIHMLGAFYMIILNVPQHLNSTLAAIHVIALAYYEDILDGGFRPILQPFLNDLARLETDDGLRVVVNEEEIILRAALVGFTGDSKSAHSILGFLSSGARHFCRLCMISRQQHHHGVEQGPMRNREQHAAQVQLITQHPLNDHYKTITGVKEMSCLNDARFFHCTENYIFDVDHDMAQGVIPMEIRLVLREFICVRGIFTVQDLNRRIRAYNYGPHEMKNKPSANFTAESLANAVTSHSMRQTMAQSYCLLRVLPFLLDNIGLPEECNVHIRLLVLLQQIVEIVIAPRVFRNTSHLLMNLVQLHLQLARQLFPTIHLINKLHHLMHYAECMRRSGPLRIYRTIRHEGKHRPLRRHIVTCGAYKNVPVTAAELAQICQAKVWGSDDSSFFQEISLCGKKTIVRIEDLDCAAFLIGQGFQEDDEVVTVRTGSLCGVEYRVNDFVILTPERLTEDGCHRFGKIINVISANDGDDLWLEVKDCITDYFDEHFNAYVVTAIEDNNAYVVDTKLLPLHPSISEWNQDIDVGELMALQLSDFVRDFVNITVGQRNKLLKVIENYKQQQYTPLTPVDPSTVDPLISELNCNVLPEESARQTACQPTSSKRTSPLDCGFTIRKRSKSSKKQSNELSQNSDVAADTVVDVKAILRRASGVKGVKVIDFIEKNGFIIDEIQQQMLEILCDWLTTATSGRLKNYPPTADKVNLAKGIVNAFPCLKDVNGTHLNWYDPTSSSGLIQTRLKCLRRKALPEDRKNKVRSARAPTVVATSPGWKVTATPTKIRGHVPVTYLHPVAENRPTISEHLASSFDDRREWIKKDKPTATTIRNKFVHFLSFGGEMIAEEFKRLEPNSRSLSTFVPQAVPAILKKAELENVHGLKEAAAFKDDLTRAIVLLPSLLFSKVMRKDMSAQINEGAMFWLKQVPCSAFLQVVKEGVDVDSYKSKEIPKGDTDNWKPVPPFILWVTKNYEAGTFYIKVDALSIYIDCEDLLSALEALIQVHHVFNTKYHPYLASFINFVEHAMAIKNKTFPKLHTKVGTLLTFIESYGHQ